MQPLHPYTLTPQKPYNLKICAYLSAIRLIAHELTHVMQQSAGAASLHKKDIAISPSSTIAEQEADSIAHQVMSDSQHSQTIHPQPVAMQREEAQDKKDETISSASGFKLNKDLLVRMLVMCNEGKLDPVKCVEMSIRERLRQTHFCQLVTLLKIC